MTAAHQTLAQRIRAVRITFPDSGLTDALRPVDGRLVEAIRAPDAGDPRITPPLPSLTAADAVALRIDGATRRRGPESAFAAVPIEDLPIRAVLEPARKNVTVFWCP